jgi:hypothetical protein
VNAPAAALAPVIVFTDLDDTLFQTVEKTRRWAGAAPLHPAAVDRAGKPLSFQAPAQQALLGLLRGATRIPVTGRNDEALARVTSPHFDSYLITGHGAMVRGPGGASLADWNVRVGPRAEAAAPVLARLAAELTRDLVRGARARIIEDGGLPAYVSVKAEQPFLLPADHKLRRLCNEHGAEGWALHRNGRNVALLPPYASKREAVAFVMAQLRAEAAPAAPLFLGLGDSRTDTAFLRLCDFAIVPKHAQLLEDAPWT